MKITWLYLVGLALVGGALWTQPARAQFGAVDDVPGVGAGTDATSLVDKNVGLSLSLDRSRFPAFEPLYVEITANHFARPQTLNVTIKPPDVGEIDLGDLEGRWQMVDARQPDGAEFHKLGTSLVGYKTPAGIPRFVFATPGEYKMRVKVGPDTAVFHFIVQPADVKDEKAFIDMGADLFAEMFTEGPKTPPNNALMDVCQGIVDGHPGTRCADYCRAYLAMSRFKLQFNKAGRTGGPKDYKALTQELERSLAPLRDRFFGEQVAFFTAYAHGLCDDYRAAVTTIDGVKVHVTPWSDNMGLMRKEILKHVSIMPRPLDVKLPAMQASTAPAASVSKLPGTN